MKHNKKGVALIWAILFGVLIVSFSTIVTTVIVATSASSKYSKQDMQQTADMNQIGEYFLRCIEFSGDFPNGAETDYSAFTWMDEDTSAFFARCRESYGYTFSTERILSEEGSMAEGYIPKSYIRSLTVKNRAGDDLLFLSVREDIAYNQETDQFVVYSDNPDSTLTVLEWSVNETVDKTNAVADSGGFFKELWKSIVGSVSGVSIAPTSYTVRFNVDGGDQTPSAIKVERGQSITLPAQSVVHKTACEFVGWYIGDTRYEFGASFTPTENVVFLAHWREYVVTFDPNGGTCDTASLSGRLFSLPSAARTNYYFGGWWTQATGGAFIGDAGSITYTPTQDVTIYAHWDPREKYLIQYVLGNATEGTPPSAQDKYKGENTYLSSKVLYRTEALSTGKTVYFDGCGGTPAYTQANYGTNVTYQSTGWTTGSVTYPLRGGYTDDANVTLAPDFSAKQVCSQTDTGTILLPTVTAPAGKTFAGWYTAKTGGTPLGTFGTELPRDQVTDGMTIYAHWNDITFSVTIRVNNGTVNGKGEDIIANVPYGYTVYTNNLTVQIKKGSTVFKTVTVANNPGYTNTVSWANGGVTLKNKDETVTASFNTKQSYTVTLGTNNSQTTAYKKSGTSWVQISSGASVLYDTPMKFEIAYDGKTANNFSLSPATTYYSDEAHNNASTSQKAGTYYFNMPASNLTISSSSCILPETLISMADGTKKMAKDVVAGDMVLVWNFEIGMLDVAPILFNDADEEDYYDIIHAVFSDGTDVGIVSEHGFFDMDLGEYVYFREDAAQYIGHHFFREDGSTVTLDDVYIQTELTELYSPASYQHLCIFTDGLLSMPGNSSGFFNLFEVDLDTMAFDAEKKAADIETYGLTTLDDFGGLIDETLYDAFNGQYVGVAIGKGLLTWERIESLANRYGPLCE